MDLIFNDSKVWNIKHILQSLILGVLSKGYNLLVIVVNSLHFPPWGYDMVANNWGSIFLEVVFLNSAQVFLIWKFLNYHKIFKTNCFIC